MYDEVVPDFRKRMAQGEIFNNAMSSASESTFSKGFATFDRQLLEADGDGTTWNGAVDASIWSPPHLTTASTDINVEYLIDSAVTKAHANISNANAGVLMMGAEGQKTMIGLADIAARVLRNIRAAKRLDWAHLRQEISFKELQDRYMELRYALRPMMIDATNIQEAYNAKLEKSMRQTFRGFAEDTVTHVQSDEHVVDSTLTTHCTRAISRTVSVRAGVLTDVAGSQFRNWGMDQFVETALEITPWSFIVNWFFNLSDYVCAWTPNLGFKQLASWYVLEDSVSTSRMLTGGHNTVSGRTTDVFTISDNLEIVTSNTKDRVTNPTLSAMPQVAVNLSALKLLDLTIIGKKLLSNYRK
jgi:hypothetical protein